MVEGFLANDFDIGDKHPFRQVLEQYDCHCNKLNPKHWSPEEKLCIWELGIKYEFVIFLFVM